MNGHLAWIIINLTVIYIIQNISFLINSHRKKGLTAEICNVYRFENIENGMLLDINQSSTVIWTAHPSLNLGNLMGQYATLYALAKLNGHQAYILPEMHSQLSGIFKLRLPVINQGVADHIRWKRYQLHDWMSPEYCNISGQYVKLFCTSCSWTFYHHMRKEILQEFTFHDFITEEPNAYLFNVTGDKKNVTFVGVHVYWEDHDIIMPVEKKGMVTDKSYLQKAMDYFRKKYKNPAFVVTSNDMHWCKENINNSLGDVHFAGDDKGGSSSRDLALLVHCNHTIITIGAFGYWAAYLAGGETIYLTKFTLPDSLYLTIFKHEPVYLPEWIGIPADLSPFMKNGSA
ncbi:galactoside alpha-(1,2)-fucosyltransferase 2-like [Rhinophrynus dorsalis]